MDHQRDAVEWIQRVGRGLLGDEPGLGKSRTAIEAFDGGRVLVVAPALIVNSGTWSHEINRWADYPEGFTVAPYSRLNQRVKTAGGGTSPVGQVRPEYAGEFDALVVDEAHYTKGRKTSWTSAVEKIASRSGAVLELTGTPVPNWAHELFTILRVLHPEKAVPGGEYGSFWRWAFTWFERVPDRFSRYKLGGLLECRPSCAERSATDPCEHYQEFTDANLGSKFLRRLRDDVLTGLPTLTEQVIEVPMAGKTATEYRRMRSKYLAEVDDRSIVAWTVGERNVLLDLITVSPWFLTQEGEPTGGKLDRLRFDLESRSRPTLVFAHHRVVVEACHRVAASLGARSAYVHGGVDSRTAAGHLKDFREGRLDVLVGSLSMLSEGLTLTEADMVIFVEKSFRPSVNEQALRRVHRIGQVRPVTALDYVTPKSVDAGKREALAGKLDHQIRVLSAAEFKELL